MLDYGIWDHADREDLFVRFEYNFREWGEIAYNNKNELIITIFTWNDVEFIFNYNDFIEIIDEAYKRFEKMEGPMDHSSYNTIEFNKLEYEQNAIEHMPDRKIYLLSESAKFAEILYIENNVSFKIYKASHSYYNFEYSQFMDTLDKAYKELTT